MMEEKLETQKEIFVDDGNLDVVEKALDRFYEKYEAALAEADNEIQQVIGKTRKADEIIGDANHRQEAKPGETARQHCTQGLGCRW